ncbi:MAG: methylated-DNA--[protein]-cysteine S-methyltransferase [Neisseriales bacterium]|nr:MAG: methylated-DNA--[protein]-cysteine S-methyltransferase [Neisseriales bacterium]
MTAFANDQALVGLYFSDQLDGNIALSKQTNTRTQAILTRTKQQIIEFFNKELQYFDVPYQLLGTAFQKEVWQALSRVPFGQTISYAKLAQMIGKPKAVRAVAQSVAKNPLVMMLPCHRIIGSDGSLTGFAAGLKRKAFLLESEIAPS